MKLNEYIKSAARPSLYTPGTATMWDDEHISRQLLAVHLNPDTDLASRKPATILSTIDWLEKAIPRPGLNILDMGCGPGLYTEHLARRGHKVTGVDISANSIFHARKLRWEDLKPLPINKSPKLHSVQSINQKI